MADWNVKTNIILILWHWLYCNLYPSKGSPRVWVTLDPRLFPSPTTSIHYQESSCKTGVGSTPSFHFHHHQFCDEILPGFSVSSPLPGLPNNTDTQLNLGNWKHWFQINNKHFLVLSISHRIFGACLPIVNLNFKFNWESCSFIC